LISFFTLLPVLHELSSLLLHMFLLAWYSALLKSAQNQPSQGWWTEISETVSQNKSSLP
jgi:hypothetical protein